MNSLLVLLSVFVLSACSSTVHNGVPVDVAAQNPPGHISIEQRRCPKSSNPSYKKRMECKQQIHRDLLEKHEAKTQNSAQSNQENTL